MRTLRPNANWDRTFFLAHFIFFRSTVEIVEFALIRRLISRLCSQEGHANIKVLQYNT